MTTGWLVLLTTALRAGVSSQCDRNGPAGLCAAGLLPPDLGAENVRPGDVDRGAVVERPSAV